MIDGKLPPGSSPQEAAGIFIPGIIALILILLSSGFGSQWNDVLPVLKECLLLPTSGVLITALVAGLFASALPGFSFDWAVEKLC